MPAFVEEFRVWINDMELVDLTLNDRKHTWFRDAYLDTRLRGGSRGLSDHCPLIVEDRRIVQGSRPFHSLDSWFTHEDFLRMMKEEWRGLGDVQLLDKLKALSKSLGRWHKQFFGNIPEKIQKFEDEIKKVDDMISNRVYDGTVEARIKALIRCCEVRCWEEIGVEFTKAVMSFFVTARLPVESNVTWVALAPKFVAAKEIKNLKPISKVGCVYKVISKVLTRRIRSVIPGLVGESHSAFVKGRRIHDGALIACETVQWLKLKKNASTILKLDL
ncbi:uncharacterized protein [Arachis hypogaea]|uniref:uncharacterized protein n=1 Tax=Arachis hypogaea TaxID=3818 RepID=UPI003B2181B2